MGKRVAILPVSETLLVQALGLPPETKVDAVRMSFEHPGMIELRIEHDGLPEMLFEGAAIPKVNAEMRSELVEEGPQYVPRFVRWIP